MAAGKACNARLRPTAETAVRGMRSPSSSVGRNPKAPAMSRRRRRQGVPREGLLRGKTCGAPFRPCVPGEGSGCQQFLIGGFGCNAVHRGNQPHDVVGFDGLFRRCLGRILRQVCPQTLKTGAFVCRERRQGFDLLCVSIGVQRGKRLPHGRGGLPCRRRKDRIAGLSSCFCSAARASFTA